MTRKQAFSTLRREVVGECRWALNSGTEKAYQRAREMSSGTKSLAEIAANDHEYATRHPAKADDDIINRQSGKFKKDWEAHYSSGSNLTSAVINNNPVADFLEHGTKFARRRPIVEAVAEYGEKKILEKLEGASKRLDAL